MSLNIHQNIIEKLNYFYEIHKIPNIIFHGPSGSGKRTIVNNFIQKYIIMIKILLKHTLCMLIVLMVRVLNLLEMN